MLLRYLPLISSILLGAAHCAQSRQLPVGQTQRIRGAPIIEELVKPPGATAQLTYRGPRDWSACTVTQLETTHSCTVRRSGGGAQSISHACSDSPSTYIRQHANLCTLSIGNVQADHNGTWVAAFDSDNDDINSYDVLNPYQVVALTVVAEPTAIEWQPQPVSGVFNYTAGEPWSVAVVIHNVRPRPVIYWTMNNQSIGGLAVTSSSVVEQGVYLTVTERISLTGKEAYNGEQLEYRIELEAVDEAGLTTVVYSMESREMSAQLRCKGCHPKTSTTTQPPTSTVEETTAELTTMPYITTTAVERVPCNFSLTDSAAHISFPIEDIACTSQPPPTWTIRVNLQVVEFIVLSIHSLTGSQGSYMLLTTKDSSGEDISFIRYADLTEELNHESKGKLLAEDGSTLAHGAVLQHGQGQQQLVGGDGAELTIRNGWVEFKLIGDVRLEAEYWTY